MDLNTQGKVNKEQAKHSREITAGGKRTKAWGVKQDQTQEKKGRQNKLNQIGSKDIISNHVKRLNLWMSKWLIDSAQSSIPQNYV